MLKGVIGGNDQEPYGVIRESRRQEEQEMNTVLILWRGEFGDLNLPASFAPLVHPTARHARARYFYSLCE